MNVAEHGTKITPGARPIGLTRKKIGDMVRKQLGIQALDAGVCLELARAEEQRGAVRDALQIYIGLVLSEPCHVEGQIGLAGCALQNGQDAFALQAASLVIALAPTDPRGYLLSGQACLALRQTKEAKEDLTDAIKVARRANNTAVEAAANQLLSTLAAAAT